MCVIVELFEKVDTWKEINGYNDSSAENISG